MLHSKAAQRQPKSVRAHTHQRRKCALCIQRQGTVIVHPTHATCAVQSAVAIAIHCKTEETYATQRSIAFVQPALHIRLHSVELVFWNENFACNGLCKFDPRGKSLCGMFCVSFPCASRQCRMLRQPCVLYVFAARCWELVSYCNCKYEPCIRIARKYLPYVLFQFPFKNASSAQDVLPNRQDFIFANRPYRCLRQGFINNKPVQCYRQVQLGFLVCCTSAEDLRHCIA